MSAWNPDLYLKFERERTQPAIDLVARIDVSSPQRIIDIGCGPGNSTRILKDRFPNSHDARAAFVTELTDLIQDAYPKQADGKVIFPFRRIFFIASV